MIIFYFFLAYTKEVDLSSNIGQKRIDIMDSNASSDFDYCGNMTLDEVEEHFERMKMYSWWFEGFGLIFVASYGGLFNMVAISLLLFTELANSYFNILLAWLAIFDNLYLLTSTFYHIPHAFELEMWGHVWFQTIFIYLLNPIRSILMCCSMYVTILLSYDRYKAVSSPTIIYNYTIKIRQVRKFHLFRPVKSVARPIIVTILLATLFYLPKFFELELVEDVDNYETNISSNIDEFSNQDEKTKRMTYLIKGTALRSNKHFILWYVNVANFLLTVAIPIVLLAYLNTRTYSMVRQFFKKRPFISSQKDPSKKTINPGLQDIQQAIVLLCIVILFVMCHGLRVILNVNELVKLNIKQSKNMELDNGCLKINDTVWEVLPAVSHFMLQLNSSANFAIYFLFNRRFRNVFKSRCSEIFNKCCCLILEDDDTTSNKNHESTKTRKHQNVSMLK